MNAKTLKALKGSIAKWQAIVDGTGVDEGADNCPLCALFFCLPNDCSGCPVYNRVREKNCDATPYADEWCASGGHGQTADTPELKKAARAELRFLKSLLPRKRK